MSGYFQFASIYKTALITNDSFKIVIDPVKVEIFKTATTILGFEYPSIAPLGIDPYKITNKNIELTEDPEGLFNYIVLAARRKGRPAELGSLWFEREIDKVVTLLSLLYSPLIFDKRIYSGAITDKRDLNVYMDSPSIRVEPQILTNDTESKLQWLTNQFQKNSENEKKFTLMSLFFSKSLREGFNEEKFIWLFTILEIYPMVDTANISPLKNKLAELLKRPQPEVTETLELGRLNGRRSKLIHDGYFVASADEAGKFFTRLENIVITILRDFINLPYDGRLDHYFL